MKSIRLALVDDEHLILQLLQSFFENVEDIELIFAAATGEDFLAQIRALEELPDVALVDLRLKVMNGLEVVTILKEDFPDIKVVVISSYYKDTHFGYMLKSGVNAYVPKGVSSDELLETIYSVYDKGHYFRADQIEVMRTQISPKVPAPKFSKVETISEREKEVLELICQQKTAQEIAEDLFISKRTVDGHKNNLLLKTGVKNTAGLVIFAVQNQLVNLNNLLPGT